MSKKLLVSTALAAVFSFSQGALAQDAGWIDRIHIKGFSTPPQGSRSQAFVRDQVIMQEVLETVRGGAMELELADGSVFTLGPSAKVKIDEFVYDPATSAGTKTVSLVQGALRYVSGDMDRAGVTLKTRSATLGIRGTTLLLNIGRTGAETISVVQGATTVNLSNGQSIDLNQGQSLLIDRTGDAVGVVNVVVPTPAAAVNRGLEEVEDDNDSSTGDEPSEGGEGGQL